MGADNLLSNKFHCTGLSQVWSLALNVLRIFHTAVPMCFKIMSVVLVPLCCTHPTIMKCFKRLFLACCLDTVRFTYCYNRCMKDMARHFTLSHLDNSNTYVGMLLIDFSSVFKTISPSKQIARLTGHDILIPHSASGLTN